MEPASRWESRAPESWSASHVLVWQPSELTEIYREGLNLCVWRRGLGSGLSRWLASLCARHTLHVVERVDARRLDFRRTLAELPEVEEREAWCDDLRLLCQVYADLLECRWLGVRLTTSEREMCPRFHVDRVGVRLLCTYAGPATEWLENADVLREGLGPKGEVLRPGGRVQRLERFDVALLKGEAWPANSGNGVVHRSPALVPGQRRIMLSIDAVD
ncbi:Protein of unknown function [Myxococcus fulvus]|uniref:DUF1826 domain-containing protein n=1 Tax=Myxococcus fulvus TaxID=33 RepID=A0A511T3N9_MYXFU|nr:DUF1826 domain-containing protein [Myxococcus fulvus]GEN08192.1 hypothetical protein MFU01_32290 [Myxococcus fulvus]SEU22246.1 Protein of unknown function [Myxococcus fulvus]